MLQGSPARRPQYRYSDAALGSSPTVSNMDMAGTRRGRLQDEEKRLSVAASSINSDDLDAMRIPAFAGFDDDTETLGDGELEGASTNERWHNGEQIEPPETEESAVTLMRAELILADAKKRLNVSRSES